MTYPQVIFCIAGHTVTERMPKTCAYPKAVHVNRYTRRRRGRLEYVCEHCRSHPKR